MFMTVFVRAAAATAEGFSAGVAGTENALPELLRLLLINRIEKFKFNFFHASKLLPHHAWFGKRETQKRKRV